MKERWFVSDPDSDGVTLFEDEARARNAFELAVKEAVEFAREDGEFTDRFDEICMGRITAFADTNADGFMREVEAVTSLHRAFVAGASWFAAEIDETTIWPTERDRAEAEAVRRYGEPKAKSPESV